MKIFPAIDIKGGKAVRLLKGEENSVKEYGDPVEFALKWESLGAEWLHVVDLDAAFTGQFVNHDVIERIVKAVRIPVQLGGGIRTREDISLRMDDVGISRVIVGTMAVEDPSILKWATVQYGKDRIAVGIDAKNGKVATRGWKEESQVTAIELAHKVYEAGVNTIIYTDISRDGTMTGPNVEATGQLVKNTWMNVIASGGVKDISHVHAVKECGAMGVIVGKSIYEGTLDFTEALKVRR
ncbi:MAG: 1-(5-phosphoribosyl)-5-[Christensenellaceae bacterium]|nr:1-(5-phosphoribosyl)-5-[(5-phosphoribosylamino)methylideneamino]imidazole-4-carboxamide isomerase [Christensenellaceae bacterium]